MAGLSMKKSAIRRINHLKNEIYDIRTRTLCQRSMETKAFTRNRKITLPDVLMLTLNKQGRNTSFEIRDYEINKKGEKNVNYTDEAYLKKRRQLNPEVFKVFNKEYLKDFYHEKKYVKKYKGYVVWAIDGSEIEVPNTKKNREMFGKSRKCRISQTKDNVARALLSGAYDVYNKFYGDIQIDKARTYETKLAKKNIDECLKINNKQKNLFVLDRNYPSIELYELLNEKHAKFVMRLSINDYVPERKTMTSDDEIIYIKYNRYRKYHFKKKQPKVYEKIKDKEGIKLRIINITLDTGEVETLITNILTNKFNIQDFKEIYNARWRIEESYNSIKNKLKIEKFTGNLPIYIYQDTYAQVLIYNQLQDMLSEGNNILNQKNENKKTKHKYQINENKAIGLFKEQFIKIMIVEDKETAIKLYENLVKEMVKYTTIVRRNRSSTNRNKNRSNKYHPNIGATF